LAVEEEEVDILVDKQDMNAFAEDDRQDIAVDIVDNVEAWGEEVVADNLDSTAVEDIVDKEIVAGMVGRGCVDSVEDTGGRDCEHP